MEEEIFIVVGTLLGGIVAEKALEQLGQTHVAMALRFGVIFGVGVYCYKLFKETLINFLEVFEVYV
jgi:hypothetical protein